MKSAFKTIVPASILAIFTGACTHHTIETSSEIKPIHIVIDVNVKVDKDLDNFFGEAEKTALQQQVQQKATQAAQEATQTAVQQSIQTQQPQPAQTLQTAQAVAVTLEDAIKPVTTETAPIREVMMGRFAARLPKIKELKTQGLVGENAKGFLQFVSDKRDSEELVKTENSDRLIVYERIAKRQGATLDKVAKLKAEKNAKEAQPGEYILDAAGKWSQKN